MNNLLNEAIAQAKSLPELEQERIAKLIIQEIANGERKGNIPNQITEETFIKTDKGEDLIKSKNLEEMFNSLGI